jgi:MFS family permease
MSLTAAAALSLEIEPAVKQPLTLRNRIAMAVMISGGWWMALIFTAIAPILSTMATALDGTASLPWIGPLSGYWIGQFTMTIPDIGIMVGGPIAGLLVERIGARVLLFYALALYAVSGSAGLFAGDGNIMLGTRLLLGFAGAGIATSTVALIGDRFEGETRIRALAFWGGAGAAGGIVSVFLAGQIASFTGGWHSPFILYAMAIIALVVGLFALPARAQAVVKAVKARAPSIRMLIPLYVGMIPIYVATFMTGVQVSFLLADDKLDDPVTQSLVVGAAATGAVVGSFMFSVMRPRFGARASLLTLIGMLAVASLVMPLTHNWMIVAVGAALNGIGCGMSNPYFSAILIERAPVEARGRAIGMLFTIMFFGEFLNPFVVTPLASLFGIHGAFFAVGLMLTAGFIGVALYRKTVGATCAKVAVTRQSETLEAGRTVQRS